MTDDDLNSIDMTHQELESLHVERAPFGLWTVSRDCGTVSKDYVSGTGLTLPDAIVDFQARKKYRADEDRFVEELRDLREQNAALHAALERSSPMQIVLVETDDE